MKNINLVRFAVLAILAASATSAWAKHLKVLMVGNSFSICVLKEMPQCAASAGETLDLASLYIGGCPLSRHWENIEKSANPQFKPYQFDYSYASAKDPNVAPVACLGKKTNIPQALVADRWDIVTIQQASAKSPFYDDYQPYADKLIAKIRELAPQAEIVIQETWSYSPYANRLPQMNMTPETMHAALKEAYGKLAAKHRLRIIPTGDAVQLYRKRLPVDYGRLLTQAERDAIRKPDLLDFHGDVAGASSWQKKKSDGTEHLHADTNHLNREGYYLQACTWLAALFGTDVTTLSYAPSFLPPAKAKLMRACAADAVAAEVAAFSKR